MVEFAMVVPIFLAVVFAIIDGSWFVFATSAVTNASREGARYGIAKDGSNCANDSAGVTSKAKSSAGPFSGGMTVGTPTVGADGNGGYCSVTVTYAFSPFTGAFPFANRSISSTALEYVN